MRHVSPLRYPGGKAVLADFLAQVIELNGLEGGSYFEPYAGGAGAALILLKSGKVSEIFINDADVRVNAFWRSSILHASQFVDKLFEVPLTIEEWYRQRTICSNPKAHTTFEVGFAAFYMNRCNRSGVISGAGPIGGFAQAGKWKLGVRFNREQLSERILSLSKEKGRIHISNLDAVEFLKTKLPRGLKRRQSLVYLDPPYVIKGQRLYLNAYAPRDHSQIAKYIQGQTSLPWIMSYDDAELVRELYKGQRIFRLPIRYSLQDKKTMQELIIAPKYLVLPHSITKSKIESDNE
jgi:DNA adenine methylase